MSLNNIKTLCGLKPTKASEFRVTNVSHPTPPGLGFAGIQRHWLPQTYSLPPRVTLFLQPPCLRSGLT